MANPQPNVNPSPKIRFMESTEHIRHHRELIQRHELQRGFDYALMQMQGELVARASGDLNQMAGVALKIAGAMEFIRVFKTLGEQELPLSIVQPQDNLAGNR
jgi:hypothetical protein